MNYLKLPKYLLVFLLLFAQASFAQQSTVSLFDEKLNKYVNVRDFCISGNGEEVFFTIQSPDGKISQIAYMTKNKLDWSDPELMMFCDENSYLEPFLTYDGNKLFFVSDRPNDRPNEEKKNFDIWYVERKGQNQKWSEPINLGSPVNTEFDEFYPSLSENGNLYFTLDSPNGKGKDDIYVSKRNGENYSSPILLDDQINSSGYEFNAFISKDESFLLYTKYNAEESFGSGDLYIARKDSVGNWLKAENLGACINTGNMEYCPFYDENTNTLYFTSKRNLISPKKFEHMKAFEAYINKENGLSKIYKIEIEF